ncbi:hypothetical protein D3C86_1044050 [compost metagenome]
MKNTLQVSAIVVILQGNGVSFFVSVTDHSRVHKTGSVDREKLVHVEDVLRIIQELIHYGIREQPVRDSQSGGYIVKIIPVGSFEPNTLNGNGTIRHFTS